MSRRHFKKNPDQFDLFNLQFQLKELKRLKDVQTELSMADKLSQQELALTPKTASKSTKKYANSPWKQVSVEEIFGVY